MALDPQHSEYMASAMATQVPQDAMLQKSLRFFPFVIELLQPPLLLSAGVERKGREEVPLSCCSTITLSITVYFAGTPCMLHSHRLPLSLWGWIGKDIWHTD